MDEKRVFRTVVVYAVIGPDPDDGLTNFYTYYTCRKKAEEVADAWNASRPMKSPVNRYSVVAQQVWVETRSLVACEHSYYKIPNLQEVLVDAPSRESVLSKLTDAELKVLGIKR